MEILHQSTAILLYLEYTTGGRFLIGAFTGLVITLFFIYREKYAVKKDRKRLEEKSKQDENTKYLMTIQLIANNSNEKYSFDAQSVIEELKSLCNPTNFVEPYQPEKINDSVRIFNELNNVTPSVISFKEVVDLWLDAELSLGIKLTPTYLYDKLRTVFNPANFVGKNLDTDKLKCANKAYQYILKNSQNRRELEIFAHFLWLNENNMIEKKSFTHILIAYDGTLNADSIGKTVLLCGNYPLEYNGKQGDCFRFIQIRNNDSFLSDEKLKPYIIKMEFGIPYLLIPEENCTIISTAKFEAIKG